MKIRNLATWVVGIAAIALTPTTASAAPLPPSSPWHLDYAENECRLIREFGSGDNQLWLRIARGSSLDKFDMMVGGAALPKSNSIVDMTMSAGSTGPTETKNALPYTAQIAGTSHNIYRTLGADQSLFVAAANSETLDLKIGNKTEIAFQMKGLHKALTALSTCHDDLLTNVFKVDVAKMRALQSPPVPAKGVERWVTTDDYPTPALVKNLTGKTQLVLSVDEKGKIADCTVIISSGHASLDQTACALMKKRGSFTPAKDANGNDVAAPWLSAVHWQIPK